MAKSDLVGMRFGKLTVLERAEDYISPRGQHQKSWKCVCDCGHVKIVMEPNLKGGRTTSCGCVSSKNLLGLRFGRLTVIGKAEPAVVNSGNGRMVNRTAWTCRCDCGATLNVQARFLIDGSTKSCGCFAKETSLNVHTTHGDSNTRLYGIWAHMLQRCYNPKNTRYDRYGARGITVCDEWKNNYSSFKEWAHANGYSDELSIDRVNNDNGYSPDNCRWATAKEQANNRSTSKNNKHSQEAAV